MASAQCGPEWLDGAGIPGLNGGVRAATLWDPDGTGPLPARVVVGGMFTLAGDIPTTNVAVVEPMTGSWSALGTIGMTAVVKLVPLPNGDLIASGQQGSTAAVQRWDGTAWVTMSPPPNVDGHVVLMGLPNGDLLGSSFAYGPSGATVHVVRWDGLSWSNLGGGFSFPLGTPGIGLLASLPNGDLVAGGVFSSVAGQTAHSVARWDGSTWTPMGMGLSGPVAAGYVEALAVMPNGSLVAAGQFTRSGAVPIAGFASWTGTDWVPMDAGSVGYGRDLGLLPGGQLLAANGSGIQSWNGSVWTQIVSLGSGSSGSVDRLLVLPGGNVIVSGGFQSIGGVAASNIARWDGFGWHALGSDLGPDGSVSCFTVLPNGDYVVGGAFTRIGGIPANRVARWHGTTWAPLGIGADAPVLSLTTMPDGSLIAAGEFTSIGGIAANYVARWDGSQWSPLGGGTNSGVYATLVLGNGDLVAGGGFTMAGGLSANRIARWNGTSWSTVGAGIEPSFPFAVGPLIAVHALAELPDNGLAVGGAFTMAGTVAARCLAIWDGNSWSALATSLTTYTNTPFVFALAVLPNGHLVAAGKFETIDGVGANAVAMWNGSEWAAMGNGLQFPVHIEARATVRQLAALPNGDIVAGGQFTVPTNHVSRWNGSTWNGLGAGPDDQVTSLHFAADGTLLVSGNFLLAGGKPSNRLARYQTNCPALDATFAPGCTGTGGTNALEVTSPAWIGSTFRATGTGLPTPAFVLALFSFTPIVPGIPLSSALPQGGPGCDVHVQPEIVQTLFTTTGSTTSSHFLVNTPPLLGVSFFHQMIPVAIDAAGNIVEITATNALQLTAGSF